MPLVESERACLTVVISLGCPFDRIAAIAAVLQPSDKEERQH